MSTWLVVWFVVAIVTTVALIAFLIALTRHALVVGRSARRMQESVQPVSDDISRLSARQRSRVEELKGKVPTFRGADPRRSSRGGR